MSIMKGILIALLFAAAAFADMGPAPDPPKVIVHMVNDGQPETSIGGITYNCMGSKDSDSGAVTEKRMELSCKDGVCTNEAWFYKFNPCFDFPGGSFSYEYDGKQIESESFEFSDSYQKYELTIDAPSGHVISKVGSTIPGCCGSAFLLPAIIIGTLLIRKK